MKNAEFIALLAANTNKTTHIRTYAGTWYSGVSRVPNELTTKIGKVIALIQAKINEGQICKKETECILIYNFQPDTILNNYMYCHIDMLIKPLCDINKTDENIGKPIQLVVDGNTGQITNSTKSMIDLGLITKNEAREENLEPPIVYGYYKDFKAICSFAALASYRPIPDANVLFKEEYDRVESVQHSVAFDSWIEARAYLGSKTELGRYILEVTSAKEDYPHVLEMGLSKQLLKVMNYFDMTVKVTPNSDVRNREDKIGDEIVRLEQVRHETFSPIIVRKLKGEGSKETTIKKECQSSSIEKIQPQNVANEEKPKVPPEGNPEKPSSLSL